ncbi:MAG TPA: hypothetical protein VG889_17740 [Rhizomicrobium sp.]|nr:hypothetical protein [Rhizomicrobium sp.]
MTSLSPLAAILLAGVIAGTVDIGAASLIGGRDPVFISQYIAGGLLGKAALEGGMQTAALGVALQWAMSIVIAAIYVIASRTLPVLRSQWPAMGILYGIPVQLVMTCVVVPLSAWHRPPHFVPVPFLENLAAMMVFGIIVAFFASRARAQ